MEIYTTLLVDQEYLKLINQSIDEEVKKYAVTHSNSQILNETPVSDINLTITDDLFLEMILLRIRGETVKYSSKQRRLKDKNEIILTRHWKNFKKQMVHC